MKTNFPEPSHEAMQHSLSLIDLIKQKILKQNAPIPFNEYMKQVLYAPGLGYYSGGSHKIGPEGDFITAPEISPIFAACLARQCQQIIQLLPQAIIMELGAGLGTLAVDLLLELELLHSLPFEYWILEPSAELKQRQILQFKHRCPHLLNKVKWLDELPSQDFAGLILGNEVIDALPVSRFSIKDSQTVELGVDFDGQKLQWAEISSPNSLLVEKVKRIQDILGPLPEGLCSELNPYLFEWLAAISKHLKQGAMLWIDYGYPRSSYYHASRSSGTLMCYYRHHAHSDVFLYPGLQDITSHVDFTALAEAGLASGFKLEGYISQAMFLINSGLSNILEKKPMDISEQAKLKKLLSPQQMGEVFKVMALSRNMEAKLIGFANMQEVHKL
ncbi:MAG: hypothetical protein K0S29_266 [Gammaproteobacteria bacterium]|jgi:SAM-dependent MidA family methyltransferase|nr:hypothetical protein [Gammaproteobacteria bacterium]